MYEQMNPEKRKMLNELLSMATIRSDGTIDGQYSPELDSIMNPPAPPMPQNYIRNNTTGNVIDMDYAAQPKQQTAQPDYSRPIDTGYGKGYYLKGAPDRIVLADGSIVRIQSREAKANEMQDEAAQLQLQKLRNEVGTKSMSEYDKELAKQKAQTQAMKERASIIGTPENKIARDAESLKVKGAAAQKSMMEQLPETQRFLAEAIQKTDWNTAGLIGSIMSFKPGSEAVDLEGVLETIKARIGFDELQEMRKNSPTGGALGQVAVKELDFLQSVKGSLKQKQSPEQLRKNLQNILSSTARLEADLKANPPDWTGTQTPAPAAATPVSGAAKQGQLIQEAQQAILNGAPKEAVMRRLQQMLGE